jgi:hypothetical protein
MEVGNALAERTPGEIAVGPVIVGRTQDLEGGRVGNGGLDAQDTASLVVHLDGVAGGPVLDPHTLGPVLEARDQLPGVVAEDLATEEAHHVGALEVVHGVPDQRGIDVGEGARVVEEDVGGPFGLVGGPVVVHRPGLED